ncbi:MAG: SAM-dependent methyltransferase [Betaproteobacteria bacterium]|nr:SAM-dependent methyltransferase [Betaproteobacteria bacterium]
MPSILPESLFPNDIQLAHSDLLRHEIHRAIQKHNGWIDFAQFMELALYAPGLGYYVAGSSKLGSSGDFVTAPQLGHLFAATLARACSAQLDKCGLKHSVILELGAGTGQLAKDLLLALKELGALPERYLILEVSPELKERQAHLLSSLPQEITTQVEWLSQWPDAFQGVLIANEVLDAFAVHRVEKREEGWWELGVGIEEGELIERAKPLNNALLMRELQRLPSDIPTPYQTEVNLSALALINTLAESLLAGAAFFIDYGFPAREFYHPQRHQGTLMCHYRHIAHTDPLLLLGLQDITSHVDFTAVARRARERGLAVKDYSSQARFLLDHGLLELLTQPNPLVNEASLRQSQEVNMLMSPAEMGELFKVLVLGRGEENMGALSQLGLS